MGLTAAIANLQLSLCSRRQKKDRFEVDLGWLLISYRTMYEAMDQGRRSYFFRGKIDVGPGRRQQSRKPAENKSGSEL